MRHRALITLTVLAGAVGLAPACNHSNGTGGHPGAGGATGSSVSTTSSMQTGSGTGGAAPTCDMCEATSCASQLATCQGDPACATWLTCTKACSTSASPSACRDTCDKAALGVARIDPVYSCACKSCPTECGGDVNACSRACVDGAPTITPGSVPPTLADTGLYVGKASDPQGVKIAGWNQSYEPKYKLWSDGAGKNRWVYLPACKTIDTSDMDHWNFPAGTSFWKEFTRSGTRVETRFIHKYGPNISDWTFATYQWDTTAPLDPSKALSVTNGVVNANGTMGDIPTAPTDCLQCHGKLKEHVLGFGAIELTHQIPGSINIHTLSDGGLLTVPAPPQGFPIPDGGSSVTADALGYLHANCGVCHNAALPVPDMRLRVLTTDMTPQQTGAYQTAVNVKTQLYMAVPYRISGQDPANSCVIDRIHKVSMPPLATKTEDTTGEAAITAWIQTLPMHP